MSCSCKSGLGGKCKHVLGTLLYCHQYDYFYNFLNLDYVACLPTLYLLEKFFDYDK